MEQIITNRLRRDLVLCHTCQYFAVVWEVQEERYVDILRLMGSDPRAGPNDSDLLQMYYDMASTLGNRVNQNQSTDAMTQCLDEFCRLVIARLSPRQRAEGLKLLLIIQARHMETEQSGGHVEIIRRLTDAINVADQMDLNEKEMEDPNSPSSSRDTSMKDPDSPSSSRDTSMKDSGSTSLSRDTSMKDSVSDAP